MQFNQNATQHPRRPELWRNSTLDRLNYYSELSSWGTPFANCLSPLNEVNRPSRAVCGNTLPNVLKLQNLCSESGGANLDHLNFLKPVSAAEEEERNPQKKKRIIVWSPTAVRLSEIINEVRKRLRYSWYDLMLCSSPPQPRHTLPLPLIDLNNLCMYFNEE